MSWAKKRGVCGGGEVVIKQGRLLQHTQGLFRKSFQARWCVLFSSQGSDRRRLVRVFDSAQAYILGKRCKERLKLSHGATLVARGIKHRKHPNTFRVLAKSRQVVFAAEQESEMISWINCINAVVESCVFRPDRSMSMDDVTSSPRGGYYRSLPLDVCDGLERYQVTLRSTPLSTACKLPVKVYCLTLHAGEFSISHSSMTRPLFTWPYKYIRRYGRNNNVFSFEAGRRCQSGEGLLSFSSEFANEIFDFVMKQTDLLKQAAALCRGGSVESMNYVLGRDDAEWEVADDGSLERAGSISSDHGHTTPSTATLHDDRHETSALSHSQSSPDISCTYQDACPVQSMCVDDDATAVGDTPSLHTIDETPDEEDETLYDEPRFERTEKESGKDTADNPAALMITNNLDGEGPGRDENGNSFSQVSVAALKALFEKELNIKPENLAPPAAATSPPLCSASPRQGDGQGQEYDELQFKFNHFTIMQNSGYAILTSSPSSHN